MPCFWFLPGALWRGFHPDEQSDKVACSRQLGGPTRVRRKEAESKCSEKSSQQPGEDLSGARHVVYIRSKETPEEANKIFAK